MLYVQDSVVRERHVDVLFRLVAFFCRLLFEGRDKFAETVEDRKRARLVFVIDPMDEVFRGNVILVAL